MGAGLCCQHPTFEERQQRHGVRAFKFHFTNVPSQDTSEIDAGQFRKGYHSSEKSSRCSYCTDTNQVHSKRTVCHVLQTRSALIKDVLASRWSQDDLKIDTRQTSHEVSCDEIESITNAKTRLKLNRLQQHKVYYSSPVVANIRNTQHHVLKMFFSRSRVILLSHTVVIH